MIRYRSDSVRKNFRRIGSVILLFTFFGLSSTAQTDSLRITTDTASVRATGGIRAAGDSLAVQKKKNAEVKEQDMVQDHSARKAMIFSMVLPGLGQAYNRKFYKIPVVYGLLGGVGYWIHYNTQGYRLASANYTADPSSYNERYLRAWRRNLELSYIAMAGAYGLQILDAYVDANLFYWDVNSDLSVRIEPVVDPAGYNPSLAGNCFGLKCCLTF